MTASTAKKYATALTLSLFLLPAAAWAERHHGAHVHGLAQLNIAIDGNKIDAAIESPAANIIGFEHSPKNEEELHHAKKAMAQMKNGEALFLFSPAAKCKLLTAKVETGMEISLHSDNAEDGHHDDKNVHEHDHEHHDKDMHEHDHEHHDKDVHEHDHEHHDKDVHEHDHKDHDGEAHHHHGGHADIDGQYQFLCEKPEKLNSLKVTFFETFHGFEKIELQLISHDKQTGADLTPENSSIAF